MKGRPWTLSNAVQNRRALARTTPFAPTTITSLGSRNQSPLESARFYYVVAPPPTTRVPLTSQNSSLGKRVCESSLRQRLATMTRPSIRRRRRAVSIQSNAAPWDVSATLEDRLTTSLLPRQKDRLTTSRLPSAIPPKVAAISGSPGRSRIGRHDQARGSGTRYLLGASRRGVQAGGPGITHGTCRP